jgi:glycosyltransferase involved in cell wall biosynthesis/tetratricopeptide (TPR) repeat protein
MASRASRLRRRLSIRAASQLWRAHRRIGAGRGAEAEAIFREVLARDPDRPDALAGLARLLFSARRFNEAIAVWRRAVAVEPQSREAPFQLARALYRRGQLEAAAEQYLRVLELDPIHEKAFAAVDELSERFSRDGRGERDEADAVATIERRRAEAHAETTRRIEALLAARTRSRAADTLATLARMKEGIDPDLSFRCWARLAEMKPRAVAPRLRMALIRARQERHAEALEMFKAVLALDPDQGEAMAGFGHALARHDRVAAVDHFRRWAARGPNDATPRLELARLHQNTENWDAAEEIYRDILKRDCHDGVALSRLAQLLLRDRARSDHALDLWREIGERDPAAPFPKVQRAQLLERAGRAEEAVEAYRAALALAPGDAPAALGLARLLLEEARWSDALIAFEIVRRLLPGRAEALIGCGQCLERLDRAEDALASYDSALEIEPANAKALLRRVRLLLRLGRAGDAIAQWRERCRKAPRNADAWRELIFLLAGADREPEARTALAAAAAALPISAETNIRLAEAAQAAQLHDEAVHYFECAIAEDPNDADFHARLGQYYFDQGIVDGAFHRLLRSRELRPTDVTVAKRLVETVHILQALGIDPLALHRAPPRIGEILVPERLFGLVRRIADREIVPYVPVPGRIVAVTASLAAGGAERQLATMLRGLSNPGIGLDLTLLCGSLTRRHHGNFFLPLLAGMPIEIATLDGSTLDFALSSPEAAPYRRLIRDFPEELAMPIAAWLHEFRCRRPQIVHAWQDSINLTAAVAAMLAGVPRIVLCCRGMRPDNPRRRLKRFMKEAYRAILDHPAIVLCNNSRAGAADYAAWLGIDPARIEIFSNGIDFDRLERDSDPDATRRARDGLGIPADAPVLGGVFRFSEEKRPLLWVAAAGAVARHDPRVHFLVCGDGPMRQEMATLAASLGLGDRFHLPGSKANIAVWYKAMDVVMLTSRHEGLPNVLIEAQGLGVPVVAPLVGGIGETVWPGVTGWLLPDADTDAEALAERVLYCLSDADWRTRAARAAPALVRQRFGEAPMLDRTLQLYGMAAPRLDSTPTAAALSGP